jgi:Ca2+-binding EF-hand superfamily protein
MGNAFTKEETDSVFQIGNLNEDEELDYMKFIEFWKKYRKHHH